MNEAALLAILLSIICVMQKHGQSKNWVRGRVKIRIKSRSKIKREKETYQDTK
jgi:hypothetical protein